MSITRSLLPLSWLYGGITAVRNWMFNVGILEETSYPIPLINVGNITVGGTGKTPHVEYLIRLLKENHRIAVLSRGYKRKTKGYHLATQESTPAEIGDEPWQIKQKFPEVTVAVDANRRRGIKHILEDEATKGVEIILLDDAYQHRYVKPSTNILLIDYSRPIAEDTLLPAGRLRESSRGRYRANIVIVTKCPPGLTPMDFRVVQSALKLKPYQQLFFSTFRYGKLTGLYNNKVRALTDIDPEEHVLLLTGIASPQQMMRDLRRYTKHITPLAFPDHHDFKAQDYQRMVEAFQKVSTPRLIITTEKDATRLRTCKDLPEMIRQALYVLPIEVEILKDEEKNFALEIK